MDLKVDIFVRNMETTERMETYATRKVSKLDRFLNDIEEARVDLSHSKSARSSADRYVTQITLRGPGYILRTEERADDTFAAIDAAKWMRARVLLSSRRARDPMVYSEQLLEECARLQLTSLTLIASRPDHIGPLAGGSNEDGR